MSNFNISFNGKTYSLDETMLTDIISNLELTFSILSGEEPEAAPSTGLTYALRDDQASYAVTGIGECADTKVIVPSEHEGLPVTEVASKAFEDCSNITEIIVPNSVTEIGDAAFTGCAALENMTLPFVGRRLNASERYGLFGYIFGRNYKADMVEIVQWYHDGEEECEDCYYLPSNLHVVTVTGGTIKTPAFVSCTSLTKVILSDDVTIDLNDRICYGILRDCAALTEVKLPNNLTQINSFMFYNCSSLTNIDIPDSVTSIGDNAFEDCTSLTSVVIPDGVASIGDWAFADCTSLASVVIGDGVTSIGDNAFGGCTSLTSVVIPDGVASIDNRAFNRCSSLTSVVIPDSVTTIGYRAFYDCDKLSSIAYEGTIAQWNAISKGSEWNDEVPATYVQCSDGQAAL